MGLAFSPHDFVIALRLWLGIPLFLSSHLCPCLSVIDQFGDHLLGHGSLRILRHDALVSIVRHPLLQDNPGALHEQCTSSSDCSHPGDLYHPNFYLGCPVYFDLSVRCTTQSAIMSSAAFQAGIAAAVGEKYNQYLDMVNQSAGDFISLIYETFGVWTPYALSNLFLIADRCAVKNGLPRKTARQQLLQLLSVTLWCHNAKMILRQYILTSKDDLDFGSVANVV